MPRAIVFLLRTALCWTLVACPPKPTTDAGGGDDDTIAGTCVVDGSRDASTAIAVDGSASAAQTASGQIWPLADVDWYSLTVPAGSDLLDLKVGYATAVTRIDLQANLYAADATTAIDGGQLADDKPDDSQSNLTSTAKVTPGSYFLAVRDVSDDERDDVGSYAITLTAAKDPDTHEPNDTVAQAKVADGVAGYFAYAQDVDVYKVTITAGLPVLQIQLTSAAGSKAVVEYTLQNAGGTIFASGGANPGTTLTQQRPLVTPGDYFIVLKQEPNRAPDRTATGVYTLVLTPEAEPDVNEGATRNDVGANATPLGPGNMPASGFDGTADVTLAQKVGRIASSGDRDFYRLDLASGAPAVVEITLSQQAPAATQLAFDLVVPEATSTCTNDGDCDSLNIACNSDFDCELSHLCLPQGSYHFCPAGQTCRRCVGGGACVPSGVGQQKVCGAPQFLAQVTASPSSGTSTLRTAQPLFTAGTYFIAVHDFKDDQYDDARDYSLDVKLWRELDPNDRGATPAARNNFYDPYPLQGQNYAASRDRAIDGTLAISGPVGVTGIISYASDEDWFKFKYPCKDIATNTVPATCGLQFEWDQPTSQNLRIVVLMRREDLGIHQSFYYAGTLGGAVPTQFFGGPAANCSQCSFADAGHAGTDVNYEYFLQVRDYGANDWEVAQPYRLRISAINDGCPAGCNEFDPGNQCSCYCAATMMCPSGVIP